jgi:hypothetical protein
VAVVVVMVGGGEETVTESIAGTRLADLVTNQSAYSMLP